MLQRASDVVKSNLDSHAEATISFPAQVQLAADLGMSAEDHHAGFGVSAELQENRDGGQREVLACRQKYTMKSRLCAPGRIDSTSCASPPTATQMPQFK